MISLTIELPEPLHEKAREIAAARNLSIDALVTVALTQTLSRLVADPYLEDRAARATGKGLDEFLAAASDVPPQDSDKLPEGYEPKKR